jgi:phosphoglycolate phosphatase
MSGVSFPLRVKAVTIDLDGTLLDTIPDLAAAANLMLSELDCPPLPESRIRTFVGKGIANLVERTLEAAAVGPVEPEKRRRGLELFDRHYRNVNGRHTTMYPGVQEGLDALRARDFPLACVTNKSERFTLPLIDVLGLAPYFVQVVCGDTLARKKPDPAPLLYAAREMGVAPNEMLMIGDSLNDTQAARAAACPVFCVTYGYNEGLDVRSLDTDALLSSLLDAVELIEKV